MASLHPKAGGLSDRASQLGPARRQERELLEGNDPVPCRTFPRNEFNSNRAYKGTLENKVFRRGGPSWHLDPTHREDEVMRITSGTASKWRQEHEALADADAAPIVSVGRDHTGIKTGRVPSTRPSVAVPHGLVENDTTAAIEALVRRVVLALEAEPHDEPSRLLTTRMAAVYCGFKSTSALRKAKLEGRITPVGRRGGRGTLMWKREELDRYLRGEVPASLSDGRARTPPEANGGEHEERAVGSEVEQLGESESGATRHLSAKGGRVSGARASHRSEDWIDTAGCPKPAGPNGTRGGPSLVEDGARLDPQRGKPANDQGARALRDLRRFLAARED